MVGKKSSNGCSAGATSTVKTSAAHRNQ